MILHTLKNKFHFNETDIFLNWQKINTSGASLQLSVWLQHKVDPDFYYRSRYHLDIQ